MTKQLIDIDDELLAEGLAVLRYDADFDLIATITGRATEWVVEPGTV
ncbi:MAG: hypothetical protein ACR2MA_04685 [Egibacteraceae bacterium]